MTKQDLEELAEKHSELKSRELFNHESNFRKTCE